MARKMDFYTLAKRDQGRRSHNESMALDAYLYDVRHPRPRRKNLSKAELRKMAEKACADYAKARLQL